jgi:hypothetical protein
VKDTQVRPESVVRYMGGGDDPFASAPGAQANPVRALTKSKLVPNWVKERPCGAGVQVRPPFAVVQNTCPMIPCGPAETGIPLSGLKNVIRGYRPAPGGNGSGAQVCPRSRLARKSGVPGSCPMTTNPVRPKTAGVVRLAAA